MAQIPMAYNTLVSEEELFEQELDEELAAIGFRPIPHKFLRIRPSALLQTPFFWVNYILTILINFGLNVGIGYAIVAKYEGVGLWEKADIDNGYTSYIYTDFLATCFLISFLNTLFGTYGIQGNIRKGKSIPVDNNFLVKYVPWKYLPFMRIPGTVIRGIMFAAFMMLTYYSLTLLILFGSCHDGYWLGGTGTNCYMKSHEYIWFKGIWAGGVAMCVYPLIYVAGHNRKYLPVECYETYLVFAKTWAEQEEMKESMNNTSTNGNGKVHIPNL